MKIKQSLLFALFIILTNHSLISQVVFDTTITEKNLKKDYPYILDLKSHCFRSNYLISKILIPVVEILKKDTEISLLLIGHTDNKVTKRYCSNLSEERYETITNWFVKQKVDTSRIIYFEFGMEYPNTLNWEEETDKQDGRLEIIFGTNIKEEIKPVYCFKYGKPFIANGIHFKSNRTKLLKSSYPVLDKIVRKLLSEPELKIIITGHIYKVKLKEDAYQFTYKRALSIKKYFIKKGINEERIKAIGMGTDNPIEYSPEGGFSNTRIEMQLSIGNVVCSYDVGDYFKSIYKERTIEK